MDTWCSPAPPFSELITNFYPLNHKYDGLCQDSVGINNKDGIKSSLIYRDCGPNTSNRINRFYSLVSQHLDTIYLAPYHPSHFSRVNQHKAKRAKNPLVLSLYLEREVINSLALVHQSDDLILFAKSTGALNSGISIFMIENSSRNDEDSDLNDIIKLDGYDGFHRQMKFSSNGKIWTCKHNSKIYLKDLISSSISGRSFRDLDLLEVKSDSKNLSKSLVYARNFYGFTAVSIDLNTLTPRIVRSDKYLDNKIFNISVSPYESGTIALLSKNSFRIHSYASDRGMDYDLSSADLNSDVQTLTFGSSPSIILMGNHNLYIKDIRVNKISQTIIDNGIKAHISTNSRWSFRRIKNKSLHKDKRYFSVDSCAYSNYYRQSENIFWDAITAIASHPMHTNIIAFSYGVSDCIYIFDLNMPTRPLYELPISNSVHIGSRCRHLEWIESSGYFKWLLVPFNWRDSVINVFYFDANITLSNPKHVILDPKIDVLKESRLFPNYSGLFETNNDIAMPTIAAESNLLNLVFHGYAGVAFAKVDNRIHSFLSTTSGRLMDVAIDGYVLDECVTDTFDKVGNSSVEGEVMLQKNRVISIPDDEFLDGLCDLRVKGQVDYNRRVEIPYNFKFDSTLTSAQFTIGLASGKLNDFSNNGMKTQYNSFPTADGYKYFQIDKVNYLTNYSWKRLERAERLNQKCPYHELYNSYDQKVKQTRLPNLEAFFSLNASNEKDLTSGAATNVAINEKEKATNVEKAINEKAFNEKAFNEKEFNEKFFNEKAFDIGLADLDVGVKAVGRLADEIEVDNVDFAGGAQDLLDVNIVERITNLAVKNKL